MMNCLFMKNDKKNDFAQSTSLSSVNTNMPLSKLFFKNQMQLLVHQDQIFHQQM